jgi:hypothetical protein
MIDGAVRLQHKPLKFTQVRLRYSNGKTAWVGTTDSNGGFHTKELRPDTYHLAVRGWGRSTVRINPDLTRASNGQEIFYYVQLVDDACIETIAVTN